MKIGVLGSEKKLQKVKIEEIISFVRECGYETTYFSTPSEIDDVDVVIVLGGDGAILHSAVICATKNIKIIGVNYGNLGFLTEYEKDEWQRIKDLLQKLENNECPILQRSILQCEIGGKTFFALNEISLQRDCSSLNEKATQILTVSVDTKSGGTTTAGDGILICTPTGSTAYSLSAGGAILTPEVPVFMLTPICAFSMRARPIVFSDSEEFSIQIEKGKAVVLADGLTIAKLSANVPVKVKKAPFTADFPICERSAFLDKVRSKIKL